MRILDGEGRVVARVGDEIRVGGGLTDVFDNIAATDERMRRENVARLLGRLWVAA